MSQINTFKPAVPKSVLLFGLACRWLSDADGTLALICLGAGFLASLGVHRFGFQKIAAKNIKRILPMPDRRCVFSFFTWKSYVLIAVMMTMGRLLRSSAIPKPCLAVVYTAIGLALILSSAKYLRVFVNEIRGGRETHLS